MVSDSNRVNPRASWGISATGYSGSTAVVFGQALPLLVFAVVLGSMSANLGLVFILGYGLSDFFWAGPQLVPWNGSVTWVFFQARIAQLICYLLFFLLTVWYPITGRLLVVATHRRIRESEVLRTGLIALAQGLLVYAWKEITST
jgi:hypothetical protein